MAVKKLKRITESANEAKSPRVIFYEVSPNPKVGTVKVIDDGEGLYLVIVNGELYADYYDIDDLKYFLNYKMNFAYNKWYSEYYGDNYINPVDSL